MHFAFLRFSCHIINALLQDPSYCVIQGTGWIMYLGLCFTRSSIHRGEIGKLAIRTDKRIHFKFCPFVMLRHFIQGSSFLPSGFTALNSKYFHSKPSKGHGILYKNNPKLKDLYLQCLENSLRMLKTDSISFPCLMAFQPTFPTAQESALVTFSTLPAEAFPLGIKEFKMHWGRLS